MLPAFCERKTLLLTSKMAALPCQNNPVQPIFAGLEGYLAGAQLDAVISAARPVDHQP